MKSNEKEDLVALKHIALWEAAIPLSQAPMRFASSPIRQKWDKAGKPNFIDVIAAAFVDEDIVAVARAEVQIKAQAELLAHLKTGTAIALGFEPPRKTASVPVFVSAIHWNGTVDWSASSMTSEGLLFVAIRVLTKDMGRPILEKINKEAQNLQTAKLEVTKLAVVSAPSTPAEPSTIAQATSSQKVDSEIVDAGPRARMGRPPIRENILEAHEALQASGGFITKPKTRGYEQIRVWIRANRPNTRAASSKIDDDTISKALSLLEKSETPKTTEKL